MTKDDWRPRERAAKGKGVDVWGRRVTELGDIEKPGAHVVNKWNNTWDVTGNCGYSMWVDEPTHWAPIEPPEAA